MQTIVHSEYLLTMSTLQAGLSALFDWALREFEPGSIHYLEMSKATETAVHLTVRLSLTTRLQRTCTSFLTLSCMWLTTSQEEARRYCACSAMASHHCTAAPQSHIALSQFAGTHFAAAVTVCSCCDAGTWLLSIFRAEVECGSDISSCLTCPTSQLLFSIIC